ncbi:MAG: GNAT family N-acetyltransferase [Candidatus Heimdallarchaeota archaeon]|nr:GNAT family N-acetyltransferase [Candidatus Heimdallarchaeota archaeon]
MFSLEIAELKDIPEISDIIIKAYEPIGKLLSRPPGALNNLDKKLTDSVSENGLYKILMDASKIIGTLSISYINANTIKLFHFAITPSKQNLGVGSWAIYELLNHLEPSVRKVVLEVYAKTPKARRFYEKHGFSIYGSKKIKNELIYKLSYVV